MLVRMDRLIDLWGRYLGPSLDRLWASLGPFWQGVGLALLTLVVVGVTFRKSLAEWVLGGETREHDAVIFKKFDAEAPEKAIDDVINYHLYNGWFTSADLDRMVNLGDGLERIENRYLGRRMSKASQVLVREVSELRRSMVGRFYKVGEDLFKFYPELIEQERFDREWADHQAHITATWEAYKQYRLAAKEVLKV